MRVSREISLGSSLHRASTDALIKVPVRGRVPYQPIAASRNSFESPSCAEYSAATVIAI